MKNIHIEYQWQADTITPAQGNKRYYVSGPVVALRHFHLEMQRKRDMKSDRTTVFRPKLLPNQYEIFRVYEVVDSTVTSEFLFPKFNPDVGYEEPKAIDQAVLLDLI